MNIDDEMARFDWSGIQTYIGQAEMLPGAVRALIAAEDAEQAARLGAWIEHILVSVAGPCEGCTPVAGACGYRVSANRLDLDSYTARSQLRSQRVRRGPNHCAVRRAWVLRGCSDVPDAGRIHRTIAGFRL